MSDDIKRRDFLKVIGVSGTGVGLAGCSTDEVERLIPYVVPPETITPGVPTWYATVCGECPAGCGVWARTREGRVVKLEGNPAHPVSQGALCQRGHASLQGLYNPDRYRGPMLREGGGLRAASWDEAESLLAQRIQEAAGNVLMITGHTGPTLSSLFDAFVAGVGGLRVEHEALSEAPLREAARIAFGRNVVPHYDFAAARLIVSFGADFLETWLSPVEYGRGFARATAVDLSGSKGRFVALTPRLSLTGLNADEWLPIQPGSEAAVALAMAGVIAGGGESAGPYADMLQAYTPADAARLSGLPADAIEELAEQFVSEGPSLAVGPGVAGHHRNATAANLAVLILNSVAGNVGRTVSLQGGWTGLRARPYAEMQQAIQAMGSGGVGVVMVHGANPAYTLPPASGFLEAFQRVPFKVSFASAPDETAALADLVLPDLHHLESWGDSNPRPGLYAIQQPVMRPVPMFEGKQTGDVILSLSARLGREPGAATFHDYLRGAWERLRVAGALPGPAAAPGGQAAPGPAGDAWWRGVLKSGVLASEGATPAASGGGAPTQVPALRAPDTALTFDAPPLDGEGMEFALIVYPSARLYDGRFANRPWLAELPDPVTKLTWHGWVEMHPEAADRLGLRNGDVVRVNSPHGSVEAPVYRYPGIRPEAVAIAMGGGHDGMGRFADGHGVNPMALLPAAVEQPSGALVHLATRVGVEPTGVWRRPASVEGSDQQLGRPIAPAVELAALAVVAGEAPETGERGEEADGEERRELNLGGGFVPVPTEGRPEDYPLPGSRYGGYERFDETPRWAMAIDLEKCTGCSACVVACQAENNVPWVGEEMVANGREMHWIRIERYYETINAVEAGPLDVRLLPMLCQHCGNAPCEPVCPVFAAYHTPDGIAAQVYNRCVGTRYCANNCPYKVRVFNWFTYTNVPEPMNWQYNPDVTVRQGGVMEKCSFCVQRIREVQNRAALEDGRPVVDGEIIPACQQSCPAEAIVFGNIRDPESRVAQIAANERTYRVLDELINTQPAVSYLKKVTFHAVESGHA